MNEANQIHFDSDGHLWFLSDLYRIGYGCDVRELDHLCIGDEHERDWCADIMGMCVQRDVPVMV